MRVGGNKKRKNENHEREFFLMRIREGVVSLVNFRREPSVLMTSITEDPSLPLDLDGT